jgi:hypothetical protein
MIDVDDEGRKEGRTRREGYEGLEDGFFRLVAFMGIFKMDGWIDGWMDGIYPGALVFFLVEVMHASRGVFSFLYRISDIRFFHV